MTDRPTDVEQLADAEYDITHRGYQEAFISALEGNFEWSIKILRFAKKRLREEIAEGKLMGLESGSSRLREKMDSITEVIDALKTKNLKEVMNTWGMGLGLPFDGLRSQEEFDIEIRTGTVPLSAVAQVRKALGCPTEDKKECGMCESVIRENCTKFVPKPAVARALEKVLACEYEEPRNYWCDKSIAGKWCPNCRARKAIMGEIGRVG